MIVEMAIGDRVRTVSVVRKGALLHVTIDGRTHVVDARRVSDIGARRCWCGTATGDLPVRSIDASFAVQGARARATSTFTSRAHGAGPGPPVDVDDAPGRVVCAPGRRTPAPVRSA